MNALEKLKRKNSQNKFICVGLDTDINKIPSHLKYNSNPVLSFNEAIINATAEHAAAFKINFAFYEEAGAYGFETLEKTISLIPEDILIIGDAKRGDIGNTSKMYSRSIFNHFRCDASTINPYMGEDSVKPFLENPDKLNFILALTSNPGASDFEKLKLEDGSYLFQRVLRKINEWNEKKNCGVVFGATNITELQENILLMNELPVLLPGVGAQGGSFEEVLNTFKQNRRTDFVVNVSRGIIYKSSGNDFADAALHEIVELNNTAQKIYQ